MDAANSQILDGLVSSHLDKISCWSVGCKQYWLLLFKIYRLLRSMLRCWTQGAATTCYVATHPNVKGVSGKYFNDCNENSSISSYASDPELAAKLWKYSEEFVSTH